MSTIAKIRKNRFISETTLHGFAHMRQSRSKASLTFWFIVTLLAIIYAGFEVTHEIRHVSSDLVFGIINRIADAEEIQLAMMNLCYNSEVDLLDWNIVIEYFSNYNWTMEDFVQLISASTDFWNILFLSRKLDWQVIAILNHTGIRVEDGDSYAIMMNTTEVIRRLFKNDVCCWVSADKNRIKWNQMVYGYISSMGQSIGITSALIMGGTNEDRNRNELEEMVQVVVGTIGRIRAMIYEGCIPRRCIKFLILDEAHQMLSNRIKDQTYEITHAMPFSTQIIAISAAKKARILEYRKKFARNPFLVVAKAPELSIQGMYQFYMLIQGEGMKQQTLLDIYGNISRRKTIVFCNTKSTVELLDSELSKKNYNALAIHDKTNCEQKEHILDEFRKTDGNSRCLITTNLLAHTRDVQSVSIIINYDLPINPEDYVHRIGRWINFGRKGVAINFVSQAEKSILKDIESFHNTKILEMPGKMVESLKKKPAQ